MTYPIIANKISLLYNVTATKFDSILFISIIQYFAMYYGEEVNYMTKFYVCTFVLLRKIRT